MHDGAPTRCTPKLATQVDAPGQASGKDTELAATLALAGFVGLQIALRRSRTAPPVTIVTPAMLGPLRAWGLGLTSSY